MLLVSVWLFKKIEAFTDAGTAESRFISETSLSHRTVLASSLATPGIAKRVKLPRREFVPLKLASLEKMSAHVLDNGLCDGRRPTCRWR